MHFLGEQFQRQKILPQRNFTAGAFVLAGAWKVATPGISVEGQVSWNDLPIPYLGTPLENFLGISSRMGDFSHPVWQQ